MASSEPESSVVLLHHFGGDLTHAQSAWCSTQTDVEANKHRIPGLLKKLAQENHGTPFEKSALHFLVKTDIATHIQLLKHRIGVSINGESARYKEIKTDHFLIPDDWPEHWAQQLKQHAEQGNRLYHQACEELTPVLGRARAKESARFFKGYNSILTCDVQFNFRSFVHFYRLRSAPGAQKEIRDLAEEMLKLIKTQTNDEYKYTLEAYGL